MMKPKVNSKDQSSNQKKSNNIKKEPQDNIKNKFKREGNPKKKIIEKFPSDSKRVFQIESKDNKAINPRKKVEKNLSHNAREEREKEGNKTSQNKKTMTNSQEEEDKVNCYFTRKNNGKVVYTSKNGSEDKKSSVFSQGDYRPQKINKNDSNNDNFIDVNKSISLTSFMKNENKGRYANNSLFSENQIIVASEETDNEKIIIKGVSQYADEQSEEQKKIKINKDNNNNNNNNKKEDIKNADKINEQKNENFNINYKINSNINNANNNDGKIAIKVNDNKINDINRNIGFNDRAHNEIKEPSLNTKFNNLIDSINKNNEINLNLISQIQKTDENAKSYVNKMANTMSTQTSNLISHVNKMANAMSMQTSNLIGEMKTSNKNTESLIKKYDEFLNALSTKKINQYFPMKILMIIVE